METTYFGSYGELSKYVDRKAVEQMTKEARKIITEQIRKSPIIETKPQQKNKWQSARGSSGFLYYYVESTIQAKSIDNRRLFVVNKAFFYS